MKLFFTLLFLVAAFGVQASETLSKRHMTLISKAVAEKCFINSALKLEDLKVVEDRIDQGVIDYYFTSTFSAVVRVDQGVFDNYDVTVKSAEYSAYDRQAQDWGIIEIQSVKCELR